MEMKRVWSLGLTLSFAACATVLLSVRTTRAQGAYMSDKSVFHNIDEKAAKATSNDPVAIKDLADEIFRYVPQEVAGAAKSRAIDAEISFRHRSRAGVKDTDVVRMLNQLAAQFNAPDYGYTTLQQLRRLRVSLGLGMPHFVGSHSTSKELNMGDLSPLEAVYLSYMMVQQKLNNRQYQVTPQEWNKQRYEEKLAQQRGIGPAPESEARTPNLQLQSTLAGDRGMALRRMLAEAARSKSSEDISAIMSSALDQINLTDRGDR
jgi:hypothetical protein